MWKPVLLNVPENPPLRFLPEVDEEEPRQFIRLDYGAQQEHGVLYQLVSKDPDTREVFYMLTQKWENHELTWQLGDPGAVITGRLKKALERLPMFCTEEDEGDIVEKSALVLERVADDMEASQSH